MKHSFTLEELINNLVVECGSHNLAYSINQQPVKVGPDCYMFYATNLTEQCRKHGQCKYEPYYALTGGDTITLLDKDHSTLL